MKGRVVRGAAFGLGWYRFRTTLRRRMGGYLAIVLLLGLVGGLALGALAAARRTQSAYPRFLASTTPSDLIVQPSSQLMTGDLAGFVAQVRALPHVRRVGSALGLNAETLTSTGGIGALLLTQAELVASNDGLYAQQDKVKILAGRQADPARVDEVVVSPSAASVLGLHVGSHVRLGIDANNQSDVFHPYRTISLTVVGLALFNHQVVQDDIDRGRTGLLLGTPALEHQFGDCCATVNYLDLRLSGGRRDLTRVEGEYAHLVATSRYTNVGAGPSGDHSQLLYYVTSAIEADAERAIRPVAVALAGFGAIAALAAIVIGIQAVSRQLSAGARDMEGLRALGAGRLAIAVDGLLGVGICVVAGSVLAAAVGLALSSAARFGPAAGVDPAPRVDPDWTVLGFGLLAFVVVLGVAAGLVAWRRASHEPGDRARTRSSALVGMALSAGVPPAGAAGIRFAVDPGTDREHVPVRSAGVGAALAVVVVMATLTFGASLRHLVSHPALYGWNFDAALYSTDGFGPIPTVIATPLLARDHDIAASTGVYFANMTVDGQAVGAIAAPSAPAVPPVVLSGHAVKHRDEIVLGRATLAQLHKRVGDVVTVAGNGIGPLRLRVSGTASLPAIGATFGIHPSVSSGALFSTAAVPPAVLQTYGPFSGPNAVFVRFRPGVSTAQGLRSLRTIAGELQGQFRTPAAIAASQGASYGATIEALAVQRPAEIANYSSLGTVPEFLAGALALGAVIALGLTLVASVRRRRRDLALLKTMGFTRRQLGTAVAVQATVIALAGLIVGVPLGIALGRSLWLLFAHGLSVVADPTVPTLSVVIGVIATLVVANAVSALPGRAAARTPTAAILRAE